MIAYRYELMPTKAQRSLLSRTGGCCRRVFNDMLDHQLKLLEAGEKVLAYTEATALLPKWKKNPETDWLKEAPSQCLQQKVKDVTNAVFSWLGKEKGKPHFQARDDGDSFRFPQIKTEYLDEANSRIFLPKLEWVRYRKSRPIRGNICFVTVSRDGNRWFMSLTCRIADYEMPPIRNGEIGIDLGVVQTVTLSDGRVFQLDIESINKHEQRIAVLQKQLDHNKTARQALCKQGKAEAFDKYKPSKKRRELKEKIQNHYRHIRNIRLDFCRKTAYAIAHEFGMVYAEDLKTKNMTASAKGTVENPGKNVAQKAGLNRSMLRFSPYQFLQCLQWALTKEGGQLMKVAPQFTSQTCPECGYVSAANRPTQARFCCQRCGYLNNADIVASINVLKKGRTAPDSPSSESRLGSAAGTCHLLGQKFQQTWNPPA